MAKNNIMKNDRLIKMNKMVDNLRKTIDNLEKMRNDLEKMEKDAYKNIIDLEYLVDDMGQVSNDISKMTMKMAKTLKKETFMDELESLKNVSMPMQEIREEMDKVTCASKDMKKIVPELEALITGVRMSAVDVAGMISYLKRVRNKIEAEVDEDLDCI